MNNRAVRTTNGGHYNTISTTVTFGRTLTGAWTLDSAIDRKGGFCPGRGTLIEILGGLVRRAGQGLDKLGLGVDHNGV